MKKYDKEKPFKQIFPDKMIEAIKYNEVALEGGTLNCSTWTYKSV